MRFTKYTTLAGIVLAFLLSCGLNSDAFGQGRGNGGGGRPSGNPGGGNGAGRPTTSPGVDRGIRRSSDMSNGRSDNGRQTASQRSNGRYDEGIGRARMMRENRSREADREIERNLRMNANDLRSGYQAALITNPDLKFGQYVAANMIARNFSSRNSNITTNAILSRLANGDSIGEALRDLGLNKDAAKRAEREAMRQLENSRRQ